MYSGMFLYAHLCLLLVVSYLIMCISAILLYIYVYLLNLFMFTSPATYGHIFFFSSHGSKNACVDFFLEAML